jgi:hypothetical protein
MRLVQLLVACASSRPARPCTARRSSASRPELIV